LAFWGIVRFAEEGRCRFLLVGSFASTLLLLSSNHISLITIPLILIMITWLAVSNRSWRVFWRGQLCLIFGLGLSAYYLMPALLERELVHIERELESGGFIYKEHFLYPSQWLSSSWGYGGSVPGPDDQMSFAFGPIHLLMVGVGLLLMRQVWKLSPRSGILLTSMLFLLLAAIFFTLTVSEFFWNYLSILHNLQFPWRFMSLVAFAASFIVGFPFILLSAHNEQLSNILMAGLIAGLLFYAIPKANPLHYHDSQDTDFSPGNIALGGVKANILDMFEPRWVIYDPKSPPTSAAVLLSGEGVVSGSRISPTHLRLDALLSAESRLRVNLHYYPGWTLVVEGEERSFSFGNRFGLIEFRLEPGKHTIDLVFKDTPSRVASKLLSLLALFLMIGWCAASFYLTNRHSSKQHRMAW
jgi:hypothetical protein